jgi:hypothetical protein
MPEWAGAVVRWAVKIKDEKVRLRQCRSRSAAYLCMNRASVTEIFRLRNGFLFHRPRVSHG